LKLDENCQDTWIAQLISIQADATNCTKKSLWKQLCTMERIHKTAGNVCQALQKIMIHQPMSVVVAPGDVPETRNE